MIANKTKRIILVCFIIIYATLARLSYYWYPMTFSGSPIALKFTTYRYLLTIPFLVLLWVLTNYLDEPQCHKTKIVLRVITVVGTIGTICALLFRQ